SRAWGASRATTPGAWASGASSPPSPGASSRRAAEPSWRGARRLPSFNRRDKRRLAPTDAPPDRGIHLACGLALLDHLALVEALPAARDSELDLGTTVFDVHPQRDERVALLRDGPDELSYFVLVQEELAWAQRVVIVIRRVGPRRDVDVAKPHLAVLDARVPVAQVGVTRAQRLDLGAAQPDARLEPTPDLIVEASFAVVGELDLTLGLRRRSCLLGWHQ